MRLTRHAAEQQQRRGIDHARLDLVIAFGDEHKATGHATMYRVGRRELRFLRADCPEPLWRRYRDWLNKTVPVVSDRGDVLTSMNRFRRIYRRK